MIAFRIIRDNTSPFNDFLAKNLHDVHFIREVAEPCVNTINQEYLLIKHEQIRNHTNVNPAQDEHVNYAKEYIWDK